MRILLITVYVLSLITVLAVIFLKIKRKEKVSPVWFCILGVLATLPILYLCIIGSFTASSSTILEQTGAY